MDENINSFNFQSPLSKNKDDCKTKIEIKKEALDEIEVQRGLEIMDKLEFPKGSFDSESTDPFHLSYPQTDEPNYIPELEF